MIDGRQDEREFAHRVTRHLSAAARDVDDAVALRLKAARERALAAHRPVRHGGWMTRAVVALRPLTSQILRPVALAAVILVAVVVGNHWLALSRVESLQDVDMTLLMDDLPIDAYLDTEFKEWLQQDTRS